MLGQLQILIDLPVHLHARLIHLILVHLGDLDGVLSGNHIASLGRTQAPLVRFAQLPVSVAHRLVKLECLLEVAAEEAQADLVLRLRVRTAYHRLQLSLLVFKHLLGPLGLHDCLVSQLLQLILSCRVRTVGDLGEGLASHLVKVLVSILPIRGLLVLLSDSHLLL